MIKKFQNRREEVRYLNGLTVDEVKNLAGDKLLVMNNLDEMHRYFARHMCDLILENNAAGRSTAGIFPVGPVGQYPYFIEEVNRRNISLKDVTFFFMDEYADEYGVEISADHHLSFRGKLFSLFKQIDRSHLPDMSKIIFPSADNLSRLKGLVEDSGLCITYGGVGIHGHLAFNEPEPGVRNSDPRVVELNDFTVTINAVREGIGGNLENFPRKAITLGMNQLFSAKKMVFFCRNGVDSIDWANTVLRLALLGTPGDDYPVTYLKEHPDWLLVTDHDTLKTPINI
jgi:glucosamine-6-phosphate deaminase